MPKKLLEKTQTESARQKGNAAEELALQHLRTAGLQLVQRNYRTPGRGGGEIDLIMREETGTVVFVEVRSRKSAYFGGAAGSIDAVKQRRIVLAARAWLAQQGLPPPCRFDAVLVDGSKIKWLQAAFEAE